MRRLLLASTVALVATGCKEHGAIYIFNGFDFDVKVKAVGEVGEVELDVPARAHVTTDDVSGMGTYTVTKDGTEVASGKTQWGKAEKSKGCPRVFNIEGGAALLKEDVTYGQAFAPSPPSVLAGELSDHHCGVAWILEQPPETLTVENEYVPGKDFAWIHYVDDGRWPTAIDLLLADDSRWKSQSRGKAQRIMRTVVTHDPENASLDAVKAKFKAAKLALPKPK